MSKERFFPFNIQPERDEEGKYHNPNPGIYDRVRVKPPQFYEGADTASPIIEGNRTTRGVQSRALVVHPEFPATDVPQFS